MKTCTSCMSTVRGTRAAFDHMTGDHEEVETGLDTVKWDIFPLFAHFKGIELCGGNQVEHILQHNAAQSLS